MFESIVESTGLPHRSVNLVIDAGNAVPGPMLCRLMDKLKVEYKSLFCTWDPTFPNHPPDPTRPSNMISLGNKVKSINAEFGIGVDGDGDRIGIVDENGNFVAPDRLLALFAKDILSQSKEKLPIIFDVKCSMALKETIIHYGGSPIMMRTGHSFIKKALRDKPSSPLAGEMSGHFFFNDKWPGHDDALYCASRLIEMISRNPSPKNGGPTISSLLAELPNYPSSNEVKIPLKEDRESIMNQVINSLRMSDADLLTMDALQKLI